jgi:hypothetical protein
METLPYRLHCANGGRLWFPTIGKARTARRQHGGAIYMLMPGGNPEFPLHWIAL